MAGSLEELVTRVRTDRTSYPSEEATRQGLVLPVLAHLGWDRDNVDEVAPEFRVGSGRVDYSLRVSKRNAAFLEVKNVGADLEPHQEQLLRYSFEAGVELAILTNGLVWWLYLAVGPGDWQERKFLAIDLAQQDVDVVVSNLRKFIGREALAGGSAVAEAKRLHESRGEKRLIEESLPSAWRSLLPESDQLLVERLAEKVASLCGHRPDNERIARFLAEACEPTPAGPAVSQVRRPAPLQRTRAVSGEESADGDILLAPVSPICSMGACPTTRTVRASSTRSLPPRRPVGSICSACDGRMVLCVRAVADTEAGSPSATW